MLEVSRIQEMHRDVTFWWVLLVHLFHICTAWLLPVSWWTIQLVDHSVGGAQR